MLGFAPLASIPLADDQIATASNPSRPAIRAAMLGGTRMASGKGGGTRMTATTSSAPRIKTGS